MSIQNVRKPFSPRKAVTATLASLLTALALAGCPPTPPCDEKISDPEPIRQSVQSNPVVQALNAALTQRQLTIAPCFVAGLAGVTIRYQLPASFSAYQAVYVDEVDLTYAKDGTVGLPARLDGPAAFQEQAILAYFQDRIRQMESDPRVSELLSRTEPDPHNPVIPIFEQPVLYRSGGWAEYSFFYGLVRGYLLSNDIEWKAFPEIGQAHTIIREHLLVGEYSLCQIGSGEMHGYTTASFHDSPEEPWFLTVALQCQDGWRDASVKIYPDGSYEKLEIVTRY
jgi:hypothetical protein